MREGIFTTAVIVSALMLAFLLALSGAPESCWPSVLPECGGRR